MFAVIRGTLVAVFFRQKLGGAVPPAINSIFQTTGIATIKMITSSSILVKGRFLGIRRNLPAA